MKNLQGNHMSENLTLENEKIREFIETLFKPDEIINITRIEEPEPNDRKAKIQSKNFTQRQFPIVKNLPGQGTFICPNSLQVNTRRAEINLNKINTIFIDFDDLTIEQSKNLKNIKIPPNIISKRSEKNQHFYYLIEPLENKLENLLKYKTILKYFVENFGADKQVINPAGLIRLPGTIRYKDNTKQMYTYQVLSKDRFNINYYISVMSVVIGA